MGYNWLNPNPAMVVRGREWPLNLIGIRTAAGVGDVNGDGVDDWAIGAANTNFDGRRGRVVVISGDTTLHVGTDPFRPELPQRISVNIYPNPFNAQAQIRFALPQTGQATLTVYNLAGREVAVLADETFAAGEHAIAWNAAGLPSGVYFARLNAGEFSATRKLLLLR